MIWSWLFQFITWILALLIGKLTTVTDTSGFGAAVSAAGHFFSVPFSFAPITIGTIVPALFFLIIFETGYLAWKGINWIIRRFPTQS